MSISFAGSRCVDERRRRRLAQEAEGDALRERPAPSRRRASNAPNDAPEAPEPKSTAPIQSLISRKTWVNLCTVGFGFVLCGLVLYAGYVMDQSQSLLAATLGLESGLTVRLFRTVCLLLAGQLAYVIFWHRARSRKDFGGRYKVWMWVTPVWLVFAVCSGCDLHHLAIRAIPPEWHSAVYSPETMAWMIPAGIFVLAFTRLLHVEMRECRTSVVFLWLSTVLAGTSAFLVLANGILVDGPLWSLVGHAAGSLWALCLVSSMLLYARRVVYVSNEPCRVVKSKRRKPSLWTVAADWWRARREARAARAAAKPKPEPKQPKAAPAPAAEAKPAPKPAAAVTKQPEPTPKPEVAKRPEPPPRAGSKAIETTQAPIRKDPPQQPSAAPEPDGPRLSKKERRRLRKAQREQERLAKAG